MKKILIVFLLLLSTLNVFSQFKYGKCIRVVDGDTYIFVTGKDTLKVRDAYINTPENKNSICGETQPYAKESSEIAKDLLLNKEFKIGIVGTDIYGRKLAYAVLKDGTKYHKYMISNGYAWSYKQSGTNYNLQLKAKKKKVGLWQNLNAVNPTVWLKIHRVKSKK